MFKVRHFDKFVSLLCVQWYLAYNLSLRNLKKMMAECGIPLDHSQCTVGSYISVRNCLSVINRQKRQVTRKWSIDEIYVKANGCFCTAPSKTMAIW